MTAGIEKPALYCRLELAGLFWALSSWAAGLWGLIVKTFQKRDTGNWSAFSPFRLKPNVLVSSCEDYTHRHPLFSSKMKRG